MYSTGSSPRMRGTPEGCPYRDRWARIIPAHAGNTWRILAVCATPTDHPRACGEHVTILKTNLPRDGSSPRMRGTRVGGVHIKSHFRIIPAYAGNTNKGVRLFIGKADHPRVCGEHPFPPRVRNSATGSSPRMRGTLRRKDIGSIQARIIPAYAGNTPPSRNSDHSRTDHPRVCGEHLAAAKEGWFDDGSSPRMRGTRNNYYENETARRIIPAYAGNT